MELGRWIQILFAILFIIIAGSSFALSYVNLMAAATEAGIPNFLNWVWPLCLDAFIIMGSLFVLQANLDNQPQWQGWLVVILFTVTSTVFNIAQSPSNYMSQAAHAVPPIALCASLEMLMIQIKRDLLKATEEDTSGQDLQVPIPPEKLEKVRSWFTVNPNSTINQARIALGMGPATVKSCRDYLIKSNQITGLTD